MSNAQLDTVGILQVPCYMHFCSDGVTIDDGFEGMDGLMTEPAPLPCDHEMHWWFDGESSFCFFCIYKSSEIRNPGSAELRVPRRLFRFMVRHVST